ncbi:MAG: ABC transporter permease [Oscillospiraceae bacterium]|nr:ABC transporter permease [Oscillospiraceae bacterium]
MDTVIINGLSFALPLFIIAIGGIYSERSGITNLALEGLLGFGAFTGALVAVLVAPSFAPGSQMPMYIAFIMAMAGGMLFSMLHALLCIKFKANQVISGVVINILAMALTTFFTSQVNALLFGKPSNKFVLTASQRITVPILSDIPVLGAIFTDFYAFEIIIIAVALIAWFVLYKTRFGMHLRACGDNPHAVDAAGISVSRVRFFAVMVSGALSGLGGMCFAYSMSANFSQSIYVGFGYLAIAGLIFGNWTILPSLAACLLFGFARSGGYKLVEIMQMPVSFSDLAMTLPYIVTLLLLVFFSKSNRAPRALGEIYDKGKR